MSSWPARFALVYGVMAFLLSLVLVPKLHSANPQSADILTQVMGGTADYAAAGAYKKADIYFHAGNTTRTKEEGGEDPRELPPANLPLMSWIRHMQASTTPQAHRHLEDVESKEILPWFVVSTRLNPNMVEAWSTGMYWFYRSGDAKQSERFVCEGIRNNPKDYRLYFDRGMLYYHTRRWDAAAQDLQTAEKLWKNLNEDSPYDLKAIRRYIGYVQTHRTLADK